MGAGIRSRPLAGFVAIASFGVLLAIGAGPAYAGGFAPAAGSPFADPGGTGSVALGDLNGDGRLDAVVTDPVGGNLRVLLGNGSGGFTAVGAVPTGGDEPRGVALVDLNGDGRLDAVVANAGSNNLSVLLGNGAGGFTPAPNSPFSTDSGRPVTVVTGDFNGDGKPDVAVVNESSADVSILLGDGKGGVKLVEPPQVTGGDHAGPAAVGDFNGDGKLDVAVGNGSGQVSMMLGNGTGKMTRGAGSPFGLSPTGLAAGDFNGDGKLDVAVANSTGTISILLGDGTGALKPLALAPPIMAGGSPTALAAADLNNDGKLDLVVANGATGDLSVLLGNGAGGFTPAPGSPIATGGTTPSSLGIGDVNGDGRLDLVAVNAGTTNLSVLLNGVAPAPAPPPPPPNPAPTAGQPFTSPGPRPIPIPPRPSAPRLMSPFPIVRIAGRTARHGARIKLLQVLAPKGAYVTVRCAGRGCPFLKWRKMVSARALNVKPLHGRYLRAGASLEVRVYKSGEIGKYTRLVIQKLKPPARNDLCLRSASSAPSQCPAA